MAASLRLLWPLLVAAALSAAFVRRERRTSYPLVDIGLFRRPPFSVGIASGLLAYLVTFGVLFIVPFYLERAEGLSPGQAGLILTALPVGIGVTAPIAGRLADRVDGRRLTVGGMCLAAAALAGAARWHAPTWALAVELAVLGVALGAFTPANNAAIMGSAPLRQVGMASGLLNMTRGLGTSLGVALTGAVFAAAAGARWGGHTRGRHPRIRRRGADPGRTVGRRRGGVGDGASNLRVATTSSLGDRPGGR